ncbi:MAG: hypothetical protein WAW17_05405 [Rhodococcus sp. (in: high G+C Gram-positive bacteria)]|uniref:hypothetical protein n=1 Tax=Rhodococcus sp. TaxID=1831 RepID=UPI003BAE80B2
MREWSVETFDGADMAGALSLSDDDQARTVARTDVRVVDADEIQRRMGEGPFNSGDAALLRVFTAMVNPSTRLARAARHGPSWPASRKRWNPGA